MKLELLNSEGPILTVVKINEDNTVYKLIDQYKKITVISREDLVDFIDGKIRITDSKNKIWHYPSESDGMKPSIHKINEFLNKSSNMKETKFKVGDKAHKPKGYKFPCTIVSVFETVAGNVRVVAEMDDYGLLHIFNEDQLEKIEKNENSTDGFVL
jgi:hypothetical protein